MNNISIKKLIDAIVKFRDDRNWKQFHNAKDIAIAAQLELAEVFEHLKWKTEEEFKQYYKTHKKEVSEEVMDVLYNVLLLAHELEINIDTEFFAKMKKNEKKYPVKLFKGKRGFEVQK